MSASVMPLNEGERSHTWRTGRLMSSSGYGGPAAGPRPERPTARPGPGTSPALGQPSSRRLGGLLGLLGRGLRATALVDVVAGDGLAMAARFLTALVLCLMMPPDLFRCCASTPTKPWSFGDAARGANAPRPGQRGANAPRPGQRGANAPRPGERGANAPQPGQRGANAQQGSNAQQGTQ
eukprot:jgi/Tetstr1/426831/TSEL_017046.t1